MSHSRLAGIAIALIAVVGLAGCAAPSAAASKPSTTVTGDVPTPTPTAVAAIAPQSRIPLDCPALVDPQALAALAPQLAYTPDGPDSMTYQLGALLDQAQTLNCKWRTPGVNGSSVTIRVVADGRAGYDKTYWSGKTSIGVGDESWGLCDSVSPYCEASVVAGDYWFSLALGFFSTQVNASEILHNMAASVAARLDAAGSPLPLWQAPQTKWVPATSCEDLGKAVPLTDVMEPGPATATGWNKPGDMDPVSLWAEADPDYYNCVWQWTGPDTNQGMLIVQIVPGSGWVESRLASEAGVTSTPLTVPGATAAAYRCDTASNCWADAIIDHSWVQLNVVMSGIPDVQARLTKALTALAAYAPSR